MTAGMKDRKSLAKNRKAFYEYEVLDRLEAGMVLTGTEVKSVKGGHASLSGSFVRIEKSQLVVQHMNIPLYEHGNQFNHEPERNRRLLAHRREIDRLATMIDQKGCSLIPLEVYLKRGLVKLEIGICRGKRRADKRDTLRQRTADREAERAMRHR